jgi:hypothetical protein
LRTHVCSTIDGVIKLDIGYALVLVVLTNGSHYLSSVFVRAVANHVRRRFDANHWSSLTTKAK